MARDLDIIEKRPWANPFLFILNGIRMKSDFLSRGHTSVWSSAHIESDVSVLSARPPHMGVPRKERLTKLGHILWTSL